MQQSSSAPARGALRGAAFAGLIATIASADPLQSGVLDCNVAPGPGFIIGSARDVSCVFHPVRGKPEYYAGRMSRFGVDIGLTGPAQFSWAVFTEEGAPVRPHGLAGYYAGAGAGFSLVAGPTADALVGGQDNAISLTPLSSTSTGIDLSLGVGSLMLQPTPIPPRPLPNPG
jgi:Protein of unknown function (DUF992)